MKDLGFVLGELLRFHETATEQLFQFWDRELGIWLTLARANIQEDAMAQGIPVLRGPYVVDFSDIPHDGDTLTLWTPQVGDVLLKLFPDMAPAHLVQWDHGHLAIGQNVQDAVGPPLNYLTQANTGQIGIGYGMLDFESEGVNGSQQISDAAVGATGWIFHSNDPVQIQLAQTGGADPTQGHVELYALVARAVAP